MISDRLKLFILGSILAHFLWSFFISNSFYMKSPISQIQFKNLDSYCQTSQRAYKDCLMIQEGERHWIHEEKTSARIKSPDENPDLRLSPSTTNTPSIQCKNEFYHFTTCVESLKRATEIINSMGCLKDRQRVEICGYEWCPGPDCNTQCQPVRDEMDKCVQQRLQHYVK